MKFHWLLFASLVMAIVATTLSKPAETEEAHEEETVEESVEEGGDDYEVAQSKELKAEASHHGDDGVSGHLDMGAYSGHHGAFGWYADFPVGGHH
ncbi:uncharacterized protein LOC111640343 [Centruroides sculpturatus]|uniref:uncharacterized protein LOC111640343 n=1 Tax=Centruroides sculpturatus TaxID=218467 RepID=UPI000C6D7F9E|nr:uncharacterized protein LOC111640343 [Centruroides sculpturatus]